MTLLFIIHFTLAAIAITTILLYGNRPARSIAWLFVVIIFPIIGIATYIMFGINRKRFKFFTLNNIAKRRLYDIDKHKATAVFNNPLNKHPYKGLSQLMFRSSGFPAVNNNSLDILNSGKVTFQHLLKAIEKAQQFVHLQYYIIDKGEVLDALLKLLHKKLKEGVEVRIIYDAFGSFNLKTKAIEQLEDCGAEIYPILPINIKTILSTINYRNHRKLAIIDGQVAFTGGVNITDKYINEDKCELGIWDDLHLKIEGPAVDHLHRIFIKDFYFASGIALQESATEYLPQQNAKGNHLLQVISGGPDLDYSSILYQYVTMIHNAKHTINIQNPYFIPNKMLLEALKMAALRGVKVIIMVPKELDSKIAKYSMQANFEDILKANVNVCVVKDQFFHSKLMIIDHEIASIGSGNFDYRSFEHNYELNIVIYNKTIAKQLAKDFTTLCENSGYLDYEMYKKRSLKSKLMQGLAKIFSPLL